MDTFKSFANAVVSSVAPEEYAPIEKHKINLSMK